MDAPSAITKFNPLELEGFFDARPTQRIAFLLNVCQLSSVFK